MSRCVGHAEILLKVNIVHPPFASMADGRITWPLRAADGSRWRSREAEAAKLKAAFRASCRPTVQPTAAPAAPIAPAATVTSARKAQGRGCRPTGGAPGAARWRAVGAGGHEPTGRTPPPDEAAVETKLRLFEETVARLSYQSCGSLFLLAEDAPECRTAGCTLEESRSRRDSGCCGPLSLKPPPATTPWSCIAQVAKAWRAVRRSASVSVAANRTHPEKSGCRSVTFSEWEASIGDEDDFSLLDTSPEGGQEGQGSLSPPQANTVVVPLSQVSVACLQAQTVESAGEPC